MEKAGDVIVEEHDIFGDGVMWGRLERVPDNDANCLALWERCAYAR